MFEYTIGGKKYYQKPLVLGQIQQLLRILEGVKIDSPTAFGIMVALGERIHEAVAVVLTPEGVEVKDKDVKALAEELAFQMDTEQTMQVIEDFFVCTPVASLLQRLAKAVQKVAEQTRLSNLSASSQQETSQKEKVSSGG